MTLRYVLPVLGILALAGCKDEKKAETVNPPPATTTAPATPVPDNKPAPATPAPRPN